MGLFWACLWKSIGASKYMLCVDEAVDVLVARRLVNPCKTSGIFSEILRSCWKSEARSNTRR